MKLLIVMSLMIVGALMLVAPPAAAQSADDAIPILMGDMYGSHTAMLVDGPLGTVMFIWPGTSDSRHTFYRYAHYVKVQTSLGEGLGDVTIKIPRSTIRAVIPLKAKPDHVEVQRHYFRRLPAAVRKRVVVR